MFMLPCVNGTLCPRHVFFPPRLCSFPSLPSCCVVNTQLQRDDLELPPPSSHAIFPAVGNSLPQIPLGAPEASSPSNTVPSWYVSLGQTESPERAPTGDVIVVETAPTQREQQAAPAGPFRRALRFIRRLIRPHLARLRDLEDEDGRPASRRGEEEEPVDALVPVLRESSPLQLECLAMFGVDAAAWMQTAQVAREAYRTAKAGAKRRLARLAEAEAKKLAARGRQRAIR